jgi:hypothetical protein
VDNPRKSPVSRKVKGSPLQLFQRFSAHEDKDPGRPEPNYWTRGHSRSRTYKTPMERQISNEESPIMVLDIPSYLLLALFVSFCFLILVRLVLSGKRGCVRNLPPGPKGVPFFGNLFQLSMTPWKEFELWKKEFGKPTQALLFTIFTNHSVHV